jgi:hypothetical protein
MAPEQSTTETGKSTRGPYSLMTPPPPPPYAVVGHQNLDLLGPLPPTGVGPAVSATS